MRLLHISSDYPDPHDQAKPKAFGNLIALAGCHENRVVSLNRVNGIGGRYRLDFSDALGGNQRAIVYGALPYGVGLKSFLVDLAAWIAADLQHEGYKPDAIHAHKLTMEGIVGAHLADVFNVPLILSIQGNTDHKLVKSLPWLHKEFSRVWHRAAVVFPYATWAATPLAARFGERRGPVVVLPCPSQADDLRAPQISREPSICTAFHMRDAKRKNAARLISAIGLAAQDVPGIRLDVLGGGHAANFSKLAAHAEKVAKGRVRFLGQVPNTQVSDLFHRASAFAMVSHRESFGLVYTEALLAGAPCLITSGQGIDGFFEAGSVVLPVDSKDTVAMASGLVRLIEHEAAFKDRLKKLGASGGLDQFSRGAIRSSYLESLGKLNMKKAL